MHWFAAVVTGELKCPISSTERGKHAELNKIHMYTLHAEAVGFHHKRNTLQIIQCIKKRWHSGFLCCALNHNERRVKT